MRVCPLEAWRIMPLFFICCCVFQCYFREYDVVCVIKLSQMRSPELLVYKNTPVCSDCPACLMVERSHSCSAKMVFGIPSANL